MRELVYLSEAKLRQILPSLPGRPGRLRDVDAEVKTPLGGVRIGRAKQPPEPSLAAAIDLLESSSRAPRWFTEPGLRPGQWIHFETPLSYDMSSQGAVFFVDSNGIGDNYPTQRLLLHGSATHLLTYPPQHGRWGGGFSAWKLAEWLRFLRELPDDDHPLDDSTAFDSTASGTGSPPLSPDANGYLRPRMWEVAEAMQSRYTAAWMAGYARITAVYPDGGTRFRPALLVATPLYVEYVDQPDDTAPPK